MNETQKAKLIAILETGRWITPLEALRECRCMRLPARIKDFRNLGYEIEDDWDDYVDENGNKTRFKKYRLVRTPV